MFNNKIHANMKTVENKRHFVTNAICRENGKAKKCRLQIDLDKDNSDNTYYITHNYLKKCNCTGIYNNFTDAINEYRKQIEMYIR